MDFGEDLALVPETDGQHGLFLYASPALIS